MAVNDNEYLGYLLSDINGEQLNAMIHAMIAAEQTIMADTVTLDNEFGGCWSAEMFEEKGEWPAEVYAIRSALKAIGVPGYD